MATRRDVLGAGGVALAGLSLSSCQSASDEYDLAAAGIWRRSAGVPGNRTGLLTELIRYATLAPSTYNSQCWKFRATGNAIEILPDPGRRSTAVDPDDHHLYVSLGCAAENLVQIAASAGLGSIVQVGPGTGDGVTVQLGFAPPSQSPMAEAITARQTTRCLYNGKPVPATDLALLELNARGPGVTPVIVTDEVQKRRLLELAVSANRQWYADPAKVAELRRWTRFDETTALATRDGLAPGPAGRTSLPGALGAALFDLLQAADRANDRLVAEVRSSAGLIALVAAVDDRVHWVEVGRSCQRFALLATAFGIQHAWVNAATEIAALRPQLGMELGEPAGRPSLLLRFGYGPLRPRSLRRSLAKDIPGLKPAGSGRPGGLAPPGN